MRPNTSWLVRKCFLVAVLLIFTVCNLHIKGKFNFSGISSASKTGSDEIVAVHEQTNNDNEEHNDNVDSDSGDGGSEHYVSRRLLQNGWVRVNKTAERIKTKPVKAKEASLSTSRPATTKEPNNNSKSPSEGGVRSPPSSSSKVSSSSNQSSKSGPKKTGMTTRSPVLISLLEPKSNSCTPPAYNEFPPDLFGDRARSHGAIIVHIAVVLYMFYCLAIVCENYFLPSLEECSQRMNLSQDVAGATFMAAGSSAPELFTAILGVFIAKGDVGTGTIVGSAVFNILFVIGLCSLYTVSTKLNWWPVARDSSYYTFTVLVLIVCIWDGEVTTFESFFLLVCYGVYILIMNYNNFLREFVLSQWQSRFGGQFQECNDDKLAELGAITTNAVEASHYDSFRLGNVDSAEAAAAAARNPFIVRTPKVTLFEAANQILVKHKTTFRPITRFRAAAYLVIIRIRKQKAKGKLTNQLSRLLSTDSRRFSQHFGPDGPFWLQLPNWSRDGPLACAKWLAMAPLHAVLHYTIPDVKMKPNLFLATFFASITWTAIFSYVMVWMVTLIGFTFGIPDSIMGITFLAAGTSVPDAYASIHVAKLGQADMAVSNSIGSNVFDILVGLALPWFVETAIVEPGTVSTINSQGLVYAVFLLFLSLVATIILFHIHKWTLNPALGKAMLITYAGFILISSALEFNLFGYVNPPMCAH